MARRAASKGGAYAGLVDKHDERAIRGWCSVASGPIDGQPVALDLVWDDVVLRSYHANRERRDVPRPWGRADVGFQMPLGSSLVKLLPANSRLRVVLPDGSELPAAKRMDFTPIGNATDDGQMLRDALASGFHVDKWGELKRQYADDVPLRRSHARSMRIVAQQAEGILGKPFFPFYGTLLGYARCGNFLDHDDDVDLAYVSFGSTVSAVAREFWFLVSRLQESGLRVDVVNTGHMHVSMSESGSPQIDVFSAWYDENGSFNCTPYVAGQIPFFGFTWVELEGESVRIPTEWEALLAIAYGPNWAEPDLSWQPPKTLQRHRDLRLLGPNGPVRA